MAAWSNNCTGEAPVEDTTLFLLLFPVAFIAAGIIVVVRNSRVPAMNSQCKMYNQDVATKIGALVASGIALLDYQLSQTRQEFQIEYAGWFPQKFRNSEDVRACWQIIHDHLASMMQDATNRHLNQPTRAVPSRHYQRTACRTAGIDPRCSDERHHQRNDARRHDQCNVFRRSSNPRGHQRPSAQFVSSKANDRSETGPA